MGNSSENPEPEGDASNAPPRLSRRTALKLAAVGTLGAAVGVAGSASISYLARTPAPPFLFFSEAEGQLLAAICEQIIPADDTPGATEAGVIFFIDKQICGPLARHQQAYRRGLESFGKSCEQLYKIPFELLGFDRQAEALSLIESGKAAPEFWNGEPSQQSFFELVLDHTRQGFYGSPRHGGNRNYASYRMMGLAYPNLIGQNLPR